MSASSRDHREDPQHRFDTSVDIGECACAIGKSKTVEGVKPAGNDEMGHANDDAGDAVRRTQLQDALAGMGHVCVVLALRDANRLCFKPHASGAAGDAAYGTHRRLVSVSGAHDVSKRIGSFVGPRNELLVDQDVGPTAVIRSTRVTS